MDIGHSFSIAPSGVSSPMSPDTAPPTTFTAYSQVLFQPRVPLNRMLELGPRLSASGGTLLLGLELVMPVAQPAQRRDLMIVAITPVVTVGAWHGATGDELGRLDRVLGVTLPLAPAARDLLASLPPLLPVRRQRLFTISGPLHPAADHFRQRESSAT